MKHLLDVNVLLAAIWKNHPQNNAAFSWLKGKTVVLCPIVELGFLRISSNKNAFNVPMIDARSALEQFSSERAAERIADDLPALEAKARTSAEITDNYLAALAAKHGFKLATLDENLSHHAVELVPKN
jgi:toxin-antitoxin system PIN domain toxin